MRIEMLYSHIGVTMSRTLLSMVFAASMMAQTAGADGPNVAVDIAPVHSLVAQVMEGVGAPTLIIPANASPHEYNLRPSEAAALQQADLVFWVGDDLTPWLHHGIETLAQNATVTALLQQPETKLLEFRENAIFETHTHDHEDHGHEDAHDRHDPHAWLSPQNASQWVSIIATQLSAADPDNAAIYMSNAAAARANLDTLIKKITQTLAPARGGQFVVFHDAYQYFETSFDFYAAGAIAISDAADPSPARIKEIQTRIHADGIECILTEPQFNPKLIETVIAGETIKTAVLDPMGSTLPIGKTLYADMLRNMAETLTQCLVD